LDSRRLDLPPIQDPERLKDNLDKFYRAHYAALVNKTYYGYRLENYKKSELISEIALAILTPTAVGSWAIWQVGWAAPIWVLLSSSAALLALVKPFLQFSERVGQYSQLFSGYNYLSNQLDTMIQKIETRKNIPPEMWARFEDTQNHDTYLSFKADPKPKEKLYRKCRAEVSKNSPPKWRPSNT
jgi:hypothetical protein